VGTAFLAILCFCSGGQTHFSCGPASLRPRVAIIEIMIARHWRGWTKRHDADTYEALLKNKVLPGLKEIAGYRGGYVLRNDGQEESEFVVVNLFDSLDAVRAFAGPEYANRGIRA
jgi:hypothetical protein